MFLNQGTRQPEASQEEKVNGDMASAWEELDDVQLATVVGGSEIDLDIDIPNYRFIDIDIPNYKDQELIKAGFKPVEGSGVQINLRN